MIGLVFQNVSKRFAVPGGIVGALENLDLEVVSGEFVVIVGPNGSGKSTLLNLVAGTEQPDAGALLATFPDRRRDWTHSSSRSRSRHIARIYQDPAAGTASQLTVTEHLRLAELTRMPNPLLTALSARSREMIGKRLGVTALSDKSDALVGELSHGQRQLLALEIAAIRSAKIMLLDEPTASLDRNNSAFCMRRVQELHLQLGATTLLVTHDMAIAAQFGDRLVVLRDGKLQADVRGAEKDALTPEDVFRLCGFDMPAEVENSTA
jgi:putative tryptophan/tyrosine transport system ATP-binding protein